MYVLPVPVVVIYIMSTAVELFSQHKYYVRKYDTVCAHFNKYTFLPTFTEQVAVSEVIARYNCSRFSPHDHSNTSVTPTPTPSLSVSEGFNKCCAERIYYI